MTLMLASVSGPKDAEMAIAHGADIIDLRGAGGAFEPVLPDVVRATVAAVAGRRPVGSWRNSRPRTTAPTARGMPTDQAR